jgi:hypothetical protein
MDAKGRDMDRTEEARQWLRQQLWWEARLERLRLIDALRHSFEVPPARDDRQAA